MPSRAEPVVRARGLTKRFGAFTAVDAVDFDVHPGEAFGLLGPNGAGKTSTMRMIACMSPVTGGELRVLGMDPRTDASRIKARLGVVPQLDNLDTEITVRENLLMYARYYDVPNDTARSRADELLRFVRLSERADSQVEPLSGGMKRRLTIARALINDPEAVLLDEPTTGLDPQARHAIWERLYQLKRRGRTLLLTTHYMDEAEQLCDRLLVMDQAKIVAEGSPRALIERYATREVLELRLADPDGVRPGGPLPEDPGAGPDSPEVARDDGGSLRLRLGLATDRVEVLPDRTLVYTADGEDALARVHERGIALESALVRRATLEDVFLRLTGRTLND